MILEALGMSWVLLEVEIRAKSQNFVLQLCNTRRSELALARASCCWCLRKSAESCGQPAGRLREPAGRLREPAGRLRELAVSCGNLRSPAEACYQPAARCCPVSGDPFSSSNTSSGFK
ncbi:hypothetical protein QL285_042198 [Trifolium repens]|nr:hypothetical protein QL285_042197 [Trifolium repens]KAK2406477.1 hypothetical protein QL285_042198 [Trifolium repens]